MSSSSELSAYPVKAIVILTGITIGLYPLAIEFSAFSGDAENIMSEKYRAVTISQTMISSSPGYSKPSNGYGNMPQEMWQNAETRNNHCYIPEIPGLDGQKFGVWISTTRISTVSSPPGYIPDACTESPEEAFYTATTPGKISKSGERSVPVKINVYSITS